VRSAIAAFARERDASAAATAVNKNDEDANRACNDAISAWNCARSDASETLRQAIGSSNRADAGAGADSSVPNVVPANVDGGDSGKKAPD
jgi:hypothetical protein